MENNLNVGDRVFEAFEAGGSAKSSILIFNGIIHFRLAYLYITKIRKDVGSRALRPTLYYKFAE